MIINGLGFANRTLYMFCQFFEKKPVNILIGKNIDSSFLNDDTLGRALDRLFDYGCTELFCYVASIAAKIANVNKKFGHLDTTTFSVHGKHELLRCSNSCNSWLLKTEKTGPETNPRESFSASADENPSRFSGW